MPLPTTRISNKKDETSRRSVDIPIEKLKEKKYRVKFATDYLIVEKAGNIILILFRGNEVKMSGYPPKIFVNGRRAKTTRELDKWAEKYRTFYQWNDYGHNMKIRCRLSELDYALIFHFIDMQYNVKLFTVIVDNQGKRVKFKYQQEKAILLWEES